MLIGLSQELAQRLDGRLDRPEGFWLEGAEALGEPRGPPLAHRAEEPLALGCQLEPDAAPVDRRAHTHEQAGTLEPVDVAGERRGGDRLCVCERPQGQTGTALDEPEQRHLACGDAELLGLLAQLASDPQQDRPQVVRKSQSQVRSVANH